MVKLGLFESLPSTYNFREKYKIGLNYWLWQRRCEPSAGYAAAISTSYRRYLKTKDFDLLAAITINEHFG